jgi:LysM repeat protein
VKRLSLFILVGVLAAALMGAAPVYASYGGTYVVQRGDTLTSIAARHGVSLSGLATANGLSTSSWVYVGQRLTIPAPGGPAAPGGHTYLVRPGDTLTSIAARHGVSLSGLASANGLSTNSWVYSGQRLTIPGLGRPPYGRDSIVQPGDTLLRIAARYAVTASQLASANGLSWNSWVYTGQHLHIPTPA